ncbi:putative sulfate exporter family transporter [Seohaeicola saemankumensis]|nr:putative sulfate exporter family transporter [Seohaeicola saemankumensis]MCA0869453.1 putative sulfate exporter family transporter [Seohaeicola saemankumensis]
MTGLDAPLHPPTRVSRLWAYAPGLALCGVVALAAVAIASRYDAPVMLFALLIGMALSFLSDDPRVLPGIDLAASVLLKTGVALMGLTISVDTILSLGLPIVGTVLGLLAGTLLAGLAIGRLAGWGAPKSLIAAGAVAICGASAALALASALPEFRRKSDHVLTVIVIATGLSTLGMVFYPVLLAALDLTPRQTGVVLGASIHDVAQVIGAGFSVSDEVGQVATLTKMIRVASLPLVLLTVSLLMSRDPSRSRLRLPGFVVAFVALLAVANLLPVPPELTETAAHLSRGLFFVAVAGLGLKSDPQSILSTGRSTLIVIAVLTVLLLVAATLALVGAG